MLNLTDMFQQNPMVQILYYFQNPMQNINYHKMRKQKEKGQKDPHRTISMLG